MAEIASPLAGGIQAVRRSVPSAVFAPPAAPPQPDPITTNLIQQNSSALTSVSRQLSSINARVSRLGSSLASVQNQLEVRASIERRREQARQNRERVLAEQGLREGKEGVIESKIRTALFSPIRKIASKTRGLLSRLTDFLFALTTGWLAGKTIDLIKALSEKNYAKAKGILLTMGFLLAGLAYASIPIIAKFKLITGAIIFLKNTALGALATGLIYGGFNAIWKLLKRLAEKAKQAVQFVFPEYGQKTPLPPEGGDSGGDVSGTDTSGSSNFALNIAESGDTTSDTTGGSDSIDGSGTSDSGTVTSDGSDTGSSSSSSPPGSSSNKGKKSFADRFGDFFWGKDKDSDSASKSISPGAVFAKDMSGTTDTSDTSTSDTDVSTEEKPKGFMRNLAGIADFATFGMTDFDKRGERGDGGDDKVSGTQTKDSSSIEGINKKSDGKVAEQISKDDDGGENFALNLSSQQSGTGQNDVQGAPPPEGTKGSVPLPIISSSNSRNNYVYTSLKHYQIITAN